MLVAVAVLVLVSELALPGVVAPVWLVPAAGALCYWMGRERGRRAGFDAAAAMMLNDPAATRIFDRLPR